MSTTSGATRAMSSSPASPSSASPTSSIARVVAQDHRTARHAPARRRRRSPPGRRVMPATATRRVRRSRRRSTTCSRRPPISSARSVSPSSPSPEPGVALTPAPTRIGLRTSSLSCSPGPTTERDVDGGVRRVLAGVGEALLDHPVRAAPDRVGCRRQVVELVVQPHVRAGPLGLLGPATAGRRASAGDARAARRSDGPQDPEDRRAGPPARGGRCAG